MNLESKEIPKIISIPSSRIKDLTGKTFYRLSVLGYVGNNKHHKSMWLCQCSCKNNTIKIIEGSELTRGNTKSCGCYSTDMAIERSKTHGMSNTRIYTIWSGMHERCYNIKGKDYIKYGGRGIRIYEEWHRNNDGFLKFYSWAINNGYKEDLSIDRIDVDGNYEPINCRWVTTKVQNKNKTTAIKVVYEDKEWILKELYDYIKPNIDYDTVVQRITRSNWDVNSALEVPSGMNKDKYYFPKLLHSEFLERSIGYSIPLYVFIKKYNLKRDSIYAWLILGDYFNDTLEKLNIKIKKNKKIWIIEKYQN